MGTFAWFLMLLSAGPIPVVGNPAAVITCSDGTVELYDYASRTWETVTDSQQLAEDDVLRVGKNSLCQVMVADVGSITVSENTRISISKLYRQKKLNKIRLSLAYGNLNAAVNKLGWTSSFEIASPVAVVAVRGTEFYVSYEDEDQTLVDVYDGTVLVSSQDERGAILARETIRSNNSAQVRGRDVRAFAMIEPARKQVRDFYRSRFEYAQVNRSVKHLDKQIASLERILEKPIYAEKAVIEYHLEQMKTERQELLDTRNAREAAAADIEKLIKPGREAAARRVAKLRQKAELRFQDKLNRLPPRARERLIERQQRVRPNRKPFVPPGRRK